MMTRAKRNGPSRSRRISKTTALLLWANEVELEEVEKLLVKMGEIPARGGSDETMRVLDLANDADAEQVLERVRQMWPQLAPNRLEIQPGPQGVSPTNEPATPTSPSGEVSPQEDALPALPGGGVRTTKIPNARPNSTELLARLDRARESLADVSVPRVTSSVAHQSPAHPFLMAEATESTPASSPTATTPASSPSVESQSPDPRPQPSQSTDSPRRQSRSRSVAAAAPGDLPPVVIQRGPDGKLYISSPDTRALDALEGFVSEVAPARKDYHIFHLKYPQTWAYGIELILREIFEEDLSGDPTLDWYGGIINQKDNSPSRLSKRRPLKIISDEDTSTILVQGASPTQLEIIADMIEIYDQPTSSDPQALRTMKFFHLKYTKADVIAETIKQVYRDLLSTNDPALKDPNGDKESRPQQQGTTISYTYNRGNTDGGEERQEPSRIQYDGLISVGVDPYSNTLIVSAIEGMMPDIELIVQTLDEASKPSGNFSVVQIDSSINTALIQARLQKLLQANSRQQQNGQQGEGNNNNNNGGQNNGNQGPNR